MDNIRDKVDALRKMFGQMGAAAGEQVRLSSYFQVQLHLKKIFLDLTLHSYIWEVQCISIPISSQMYFLTDQQTFGQLLSIKTTLNEYISEFIIFYLYNEFSQAGKAAAAEEAAKAVEDIARRAAVKVFLFV